MTATILDGKATLATVKAELRVRIEALAARGVVPGLGTVLVGDDPASQWYVGAKHRDCAEIGINSIARELPTGSSLADVLAVVDELNSDPACTAFLVQQPTGWTNSRSCPGSIRARTSTGCTRSTSVRWCSVSPARCRAPRWGRSSCCGDSRCRSPAPTR